jgi:hypothetical protein
MNPLLGAHTPTCTFVQGFGGNAVSVYSDGGLRGHPGIDIGCGYGTPILSPVTMRTYNVIKKTDQFLGPQGYTQVAGIVETPLETFEFLIGHCDPRVGNDILVKEGDLIATEANHGPVWYGSLSITLEMQQAGDKRGSHRHYQKRPLLKGPKASGTWLNTDDGPYRDEQGNYYLVYEFNNGYNGCVDWSQPLFTRNLFLGCTGYDVLLLQRALVKEVGFDPANCIGTFGPKTFAGVLALQKKRGISATGFVGPLTRASLNSTYGQLA